MTITDEATSALDLFQSDLIRGEGETVLPGAEVTVHYVGVGLNSGNEFDSSWDRDAPISFSLDQVIPGWSEGVVGMQVGGRRLLVIPGDLAYGEAGIPQAGIGSNETLVFVVDLLAIVQ
ncbi:MAG: FKBP-type peptidyl-prolyl cis-trans isomerase [Candidatus Nanopelagicales bacterium]